MERVIDTMYKKSKYKKLIVCSILLIVPLRTVCLYERIQSTHYGYVRCMDYCCIRIESNLRVCRTLNLAHGTLSVYAYLLCKSWNPSGDFRGLPRYAAFGCNRYSHLENQGHYFPIATMCLGIAVYYAIAKVDILLGACGPMNIRLDQSPYCEQ